MVPSIENRLPRGLRMAKGLSRAPEHRAGGGGADGPGSPRSPKSYEVGVEYEQHRSFMRRREELGQMQRPPVEDCKSFHRPRFSPCPMLPPLFPPFHDAGRSLLPKSARLKHLKRNGAVL